MCCLLYIGLGAARSHHSGEHNVARPKGFVHFHAIFLGGAHIFFAQQSAVDAIQNHISDAGDDTLGEALVQHRDAGCHDVARHRNYCLAAARLHIDRAKLKYKGLIYCFNKLTPRFNYKRIHYLFAEYGQCRRASNRCSPVDRTCPTPQPSTRRPDTIAGPAHKLTIPVFCSFGRKKTRFFKNKK